MSTSGLQDGFRIQVCFLFLPTGGPGADAHSRSTMFLKLKMSQPGRIFPHKFQEEKKNDGTEQQNGGATASQKKEKRKKETHIQKQTGARLPHLSRLAQVAPTQARVTAALNQHPSSIIITIIIISRYPNNPPAGATNQEQIIPG